MSTTNPGGYSPSGGDPQGNGWSHTKGTGKLRPGQAIAWGFKAITTNPGPMLLIGLVMAVLNEMTVLPWVGPLAAIGSLLIIPVILSVALQQTLKARFQHVQAPAYGKALGMLGVFIAVSFGIVLLLTFIALVFAVAGMDLSLILTDPEAAVDHPSTLRGLMILVVLLVVMCLLIAPFFVFPAYFAADDNGSFGNALRAGLSAAARNYLSTLATAVFIIVLGIIAQLPAYLASEGMLNGLVGTLLTIALSLLITPYSYLVGAHAYRQVSGGPVPHEAAEN
ncbi:hypothetical protein CGLAUT_11920 [Corynebacterium glaucum]|uniref:hypothetical protein n=1 Tax=Corynebacterium glaucum TaxID=187491 RepID=UPI0025B46B0D|nr:hypothetical protein [Corynebacterium glaucum]WJZ08836.1 hypothetical protein CGLAUT_11920 [Corynebacterium glaucum]